VKVVGIVSRAGVTAGIAGKEAGATAVMQPFNLTEEADYDGILYLPILILLPIHTCLS
jgi:hypothetical protein